MLKHLRIAVTALSLTAGVLLVALWVRSYWDTDPAEVIGIPVWLMNGTLRVYDPFPPPANLGDDGIYFGDASIGFPIWMLVIGAITVAATPWLRWRFSLRTMLIATTLVAVALAAISTHHDSPAKSPLAVTPAL
jgi:hypothetical protein